MVANCDHLAKLKYSPSLPYAFTESNLPIRVDIMDWARIPASFYREIERAHVVVQEGKT